MNLEEIKTKEKISPAFEPFLAESGTKDMQEAVVIFRSPAIPELLLSGRMRELKTRLDFIKEKAKLHKPMEDRILRTYQREGRKELSGFKAISSSTVSRNLPVFRVEVTRKTLLTLAEVNDVLAVLPNQPISLIQPKLVNYTDLEKYEEKKGTTWGLEHLSILDLWPTTKGRDINVAVIDTGVYGEHPVLTDRVKDFIIVDPLGRLIETQENKTFDCGQHGTHVCGIIAGGETPEGISIGIAPQANLLVVATLMGSATIFSLIQGISWAVENGADIINLSLGFTYYEPLFTSLFEYINELGILPVVAIGNEYHGSTSSPGNASNAFSVGALEKMSYGKIDVAPYSSGASLVFPGDENDLITKPDVVAPGSQVYSCIPPEIRHGGTYEYAYMDGTSMATPHVAGVAALLMAAEPTAPVSDIIRVLKETAKHPSGVNRRPDNRWGFGRIRPIEALKALRS